QAQRDCVLPDAVWSWVNGIGTCKSSVNNWRQVGLDVFHQVLVDQAGWYLVAGSAGTLEAIRHRQRISAGVALEGIPQITARVGRVRPRGPGIVDLCIGESAQVPSQFRLGGDVQQVGYIGPDTPVALIAKIEPALGCSAAEAVWKQRPADHAAKLVLFVGNRIGDEEVARIQVVVS